ncbi:MAG TPA: peroxiredoxin [Candidatus Acidoferrum sp.]|nr:peroxiredoxin [Candidatus Acidoferrum sp.]
MRNSRNVSRWILGVLAVLALLAALGIHQVRAAAASAPVAGALAPDFTLPSQSGADVSLHDFRGKWVVLYFYPKDLSHGCTIEAHNFQRDQAKYQALDAVILGISTDSTKSHQQFCTKEGLNFKLLSDSKYKVSKEYGSFDNLGIAKISARHTFLIAPDGRVAKAFLDVNPSTHSQQVLAALTELEKK